MSENKLSFNKEASVLYSGKVINVLEKSNGKAVFVINQSYYDMTNKKWAKTNFFTYNERTIDELIEALTQLKGKIKSIPKGD